jgi:hypothetical protein
MNTMHILQPRTIRLPVPSSAEGNPTPRLPIMIMHLRRGIPRMHGPVDPLTSPRKHGRQVLLTRNDVGDTTVGAGVTIADL